MRVFHSQRIRDESEVGAARRGVRRYAETRGFSETELAELEIVVQEIGTNAVRYATPESCLHWTSPLGDESGVEIFYWDKGPGIDDLDRAVRDGVSSGGSLGGGFGAIRRLTDEFEIYSTVRGMTSRNLVLTRRTTHGTAILVRKRVAAVTATPATRDARQARQTEYVRHVGVWSRPHFGEVLNGDAYFTSRFAGSELIAVIDGLGHGAGAHEAARVALGSLAQWKGEPLEDVFYAAHDALRATRGAVMGACVVDKENEAFYYAGVGNVDVRVFDAPEPIRPFPNNGTLGARLSTIRVWAHRWPEGATIVMSTDGVSTKWDLASYPGLLKKSPQLMAGVLLRDYERTSDDATILVAR